MVPLMLLGLLCIPTLPADEAVNVSARLDAENLLVGEPYEILVEFNMADGWSASGAGIPHPILQILVPASAKLAGDTLRSQKELSGNEFLRAPYERLIDEQPMRVQFRLTKEPAPGESFEFNVLAYVSRSDEDDSWFVRRRLKLPLAPGAESKEVSVDRSDWGKTKLLQLGDKATSFILPRADGSKVKLRDYRGKKNVVVTTYRAHW